MTLRLPPPLDRPLAVAEEDGRVLLLDGEALVAEARPGAPDVVVPAAVTFAEAEEAARHHVRFAGENFSECFSCGVRPDDGLCINPGAVAGRDLHAAPWVAHEVSPEVVWAAIDCSGAYAVGGPGRGEVVLGRMAAEIHRLPEEGEQCVVVAWPLGEDGRKLYAGTALLGGDGEPLAVSAPDLDPAEERVAAPPVEAVRREDGGADRAYPEPIERWLALRLGERVHREATGAVEPQLVSSAVECGEERIAVPCGAVADPGALLLAVGSGPPRQLRAGDDELLGQVRSRCRDYPGRAMAPLEPDLARAVVLQLLTRRRRPVREEPARGAAAGMPRPRRRRSARSRRARGSLPSARL